MRSFRDDPQRFGLSRWELTVRCGMLQAYEVIFISNGGGWCDTVAKSHFHDAIRILDRYHLSEHIWEAPRALYSDEADAKRWASRCHGVLKESSGIGLLRFLERSRRSRSAATVDSKELYALIGCVQPRVAITDYVEYSERDLVIGSGMMESTCKQLVGKRIKGCGRQWSGAGALAMSGLICEPLEHFSFLYTGSFAIPRPVSKREFAQADACGSEHRNGKCSSRMLQKGFIFRFEFGLG